MPPSGRAVQCTCTVPKCHFLQQPWSDCGRKTSYFKLILEFLLSFWFLDFMPVLSSLRSVFKPQKLQKKYPQSHFADLEGRGPAFLQSRKSCKKRKTGFRGKHLKKKFDESVLVEMCWRKVCYLRLRVINPGSTLGTLGPPVMSSVRPTC